MTRGLLIWLDVLSQSYANTGEDQLKLAEVPELIPNNGETLCLILKHLHYLATGRLFGGEISAAREFWHSF